MKRVLTLDTDGRLSPACPIPDEIGTEYHASLRREPRSVAQHRRYWAMLAEVCASWPEDQSRDYWGRVLRDLMQAGPDIDTVHALIKRVLDVESIAFDAMEQDAAVDFYRRADELLRRWING